MTALAERRTVAATADEGAIMPPRSKPEGIAPRHRRDCPRPGDWGWDHCGCTPTYQAQAWSPRDRKRVSRSFTGKGALAAAKGWRRDASQQLEQGKMRVGGSVTLKVAAERWLALAEAGTVRTRSRRPYKPSVLRGYRQALEQRILPELGSMRLDQLRLSDVQDLADELLLSGGEDGKPLDPSTVRNAMMPLRAVFRRALTRGDVGVNPTHGLELPAPEGKRDRIATPDEATRLLAALPQGDRALWATAMYAGIRRGELAALDVDHLDMDAGLIRVEHSWDVKEGRVPVKSAAAKRAVPIPKVLRAHLTRHLLTLGHRGLVFGREADVPFRLEVPGRRAARIWTEAKLTPLGLHEARHTYASLMIAAGASSGVGVNMKALSVFMGHASIQITYDRYGHLLPGTEAEAARMLDSYLEASGG